MNDGYAFRHVARMEWIKLWSLRSVRWTLVAGMVATVAMGVVVGLSTRSAAGDPTSNVLAGAILGQVVTGVLGVLAMTSEYSSGMIRVTFGAVPRRRLVLLAKAVVTGGVFLAAGEIAMLAAFAAGTAVLRSGVPHPSLGSPAVLRAVLMTGAYLALTGLIGLGVGVLIRHGAAAVATLVGGLFVAPIVIGAVARGAGPAHAGTDRGKLAGGGQAGTGVRLVAVAGNGDRGPVPGGRADGRRLAANPPGRVISTESQPPGRARRLIAGRRSGVIAGLGGLMLVAVAAD